MIRLSFFYLMFLAYFQVCFGQEELSYLSEKEINDLNQIMKLKE
jgi:hypothetical protein